MTSARKEHIRPLTGLRALTIVWVIVGHTSGVIAGTVPELGFFAELSSRICFRMDLLFVVGGFVLAYASIEQGENLTFARFRTFLLKRLGHLYPGHLATLLPLILAGVLAQQFGLPFDVKGYADFSAIPAHLTLTQSWPFLSSMAIKWNYPSWFLSAVFFAYLFAFPLSWVLVQKLRNSVWAYVWLFGPPVAWVAASRVDALAEFHLVIRACCGFVCGSALYVLFAQNSPLVRAAQKHLNKIMLVVLALILGTYAAPDAANSALRLGIPFLVAALTAENSAVAKVFTLRPVLWLGQHSYALFISHALALKLMKLLLPAPNYSSAPLYVRVAVLVAYLAVILLVGVLVRRFVEVPCANAVKSWLKRSKVSPVLKPSPAVGLPTAAGNPQNEQRWRLPVSTASAVPKVAAPEGS